LRRVRRVLLSMERLLDNDGQGALGVGEFQKLLHKPNEDIARETRIPFVHKNYL
jgi:hypothetical protein